jgi:ferredoxin
MPKLTVEGVGEFEVPADKRLVLALRDEGGIDQLHACGGNAKCTTCKVEFVAGEPDRMTEAEKQVLAARALSGVRLSCQIPCDQRHDRPRHQSADRQRPRRRRQAPRRRHHPAARVGSEGVSHLTARTG